MMTDSKNANLGYCCFDNDIISFDTILKLFYFIKKKNGQLTLSNDLA